MAQEGSAIHGRARELALLGALLGHAQIGPVDPVLLLGEAGMGKSALLDDLAGAAARQRMRVVRSRSPAGADTSPFAMVEDLARGLADHLPQLSPQDAGALRAASVDGAERPGLVAGALLELLAESAQERPVLLLLDDLQSADRDSVAAVCLAVGRLQAERVAVVGAARPRPPLDPHLQDWAAVEVAPLEVQAAAQLLQSHLPVLAPGRPALDDSRARVLADALGCCPLALVEAGRLLSPAQLAGTEPLPDPLPVDDRLMAAWGAEWSALAAPSRTAILAFCVTAGSGPGLLNQLLADLDLGPDDLDPSRSERLLVPHEGRLGLELAHPLIRDAVLAAAGGRQVRAMHSRAAAVARDQGAAPSIVVAHLAASAVPGDTAVIPQLLDEAERALARDLAEPAGRALLAAASLTLPSPARGRLAARAAEVLLSGSMVGDFAPVLKLVDESGAHTLSAEERLWVDWARSEQAVDLRQQLHSIQATAAHAREAGSPMLSWILLSAITSAWCLGDAGTATASAAALRELADPLRAAPDSPLPPWACRGVHAVNLFMTGEVASAHHEMQAVRAQSRAWRPRPDSPSMQMTAVTVVDDVMGQLDPWVDDRLAEVDRWFQRDPGQAVHFVRRVQAERARRRGELAVAEALVEEARRGLVRPSPLSRAWLAVTSMLVCAVTGDSAGVRSEAAQLRHDARLIGWVTIAPVADRAEGLLALGAGRLDDALLHLEPLTEGSLLGLGPWDAVPMGRADLVEALVRADEGARAAEVAHDLAEALGPSPDPIARGLVDRVRGIVDRGDEAGAALTRSAAAFREAGDPFEEARTRLLLGQLLRRERRIGPARRELRLAHATFERIGAAPWQADALAELRATRAAIPAPTRDPWADLTPQERRVAEAVAAGGTDRQVAAELFLSARTVGYHLTNVYRKLGVSNRTALAARLAERRPAAGQAGPG